MKHLFSILFLICSLFASGQEKLTRILFILDASNSMNAPWGDQTRIEAAKELLIQTVDSLSKSENIELALRVYGHQTPITATYQDCNDTKLEIPFGPDNFNLIKSFIKTLKAKGTTPIARSLEAAASDFPDLESRNVIILITDGLEACDNDPCVMAKKLHDKKVGITPFVIGLGLDLSYLEQFKCIGSYSEADSKNSFKNALNNVVNKVLTNTTVQLNLNNSEGKPLETDVSFLLYKAGTNELKYQFQHTLNRYGNPDTLILDPSLTYDLVLNTIPRKTMSNITIKKNIHNTIKIDAPQGFLKIKSINSMQEFNIPTRVVELANPTTTLNVQAINLSEKYIVGKYAIEILTLPRIYATVEIKQNTTNTYEIDPPGIMAYETNDLLIAQILTKNKDGYWDWVCNLSPYLKSGQWQLQPGTYRIIYRKKNVKSTVYSYTSDFKIYSNKTINLTF